MLPVAVIIVAVFVIPLTIAAQFYHLVVSLPLVADWLLMNLVPNVTVVIATTVVVAVAGKETLVPTLTVSVAVVGNVVIESHCWH